MKFYSKHNKICTEENEFENVVYKLVAILSRPSNELKPLDQTMTIIPVMASRAPIQYKDIVLPV